MHFLTTSILYVLAVLLAGFCGYGLVRSLLPEPYRRYGLLIMPAVGLPAVCWLTFVLSGALRIPTSQAVWLALVVLTLFNGLVYWRVRPRDRWPDLLAAARKGLLLAGTLLVVIEWPLFYVGAETYLGTVNPDYFFQFLDNHYLRHQVATTQGYPTADTYSLFENSAQRMVLSGRFIGELYQLVLENVLRVLPRTALTLSIGVYLFCLPLTIYFMARVALQLPEAAAVLSAVLTGISAPISLSFVSALVGQNSVLPLVPLLLTLLYILVRQPCLRILLLNAIIVGSFLLMYVPMLPYAAAPVGGMAVYLVLTRRLRIRDAVRYGLGLLALVAVPLLPYLDYVASWAESWVSLLRKTFVGEYFIDYLTEQFFPLLLGLSSYPISHSLARVVLGSPAEVILVGLSALVLLCLGVAYLDWARGQSDGHRVVMVAFGLAAFGSVWWVYGFQRQYGYALFKMASWLQFFLLPLAAHGIWRVASAAARARTGARRALLVCLLALSVGVFAGSNLAASIDYGYKSLGTDPVRGLVVNSLGVSGNRDYLELETAVPRIVKPDESVGVGLSDSIQGSWVGYYLRRVKVSILSHILLPGDDERLPDPITRKVVDSAGTVLRDTNEYWHGNRDAFYLMLDPEHVGGEVIDQVYPGPVWRNRTFQLLRGTDVKDLMVAGRGFYRVERDPGGREYWRARRFRWTAEGGELYLFRPEAPGEPYQVSVHCLTGYGIPAATRNLEFWHNQTKFDEQAVHGQGRLVSRPFYPTGEMDRIVIRIKEKVPPLPRRFALYNRHIPAEYRSLNLMVSGVRLIRGRGSAAGSGVYRRWSGDELFTSAASFDGIEPNRWLREEGTISFVRPAGRGRVRVTMLVPGRPEYAFPYGVSVTAEGIEKTAQADRPGLLEATIDLPAADAPKTSVLRLKPDRWFVPKGYNHMIRSVVQSIRLEAIEYERATAK